MVHSEEEGSRDEQLMRQLNTLAPPAWDPLFRVRVMERKQREWVRRQVARTVGVLGLGLAMGTMLDDGANESARIVGLALALGAGLAVYTLALRSVFRRF